MEVTGSFIEGRNHDLRNTTVHRAAFDAGDDPVRLHGHYRLIFPKERNMKKTGDWHNGSLQPDGGIRCSMVR